MADGDAHTGELSVVIARQGEYLDVSRRGPVRRLRRWWYRTPNGHVAAVLTCAGIIVLVGVLIAVH